MTKSNAQQKAQAGDLILVTNTQFSFGKYSAGDILEVLSANDAGVQTVKGAVFNEEFDVVDSSKLIDVVAKLIRKNSALETQVRMTQNNTETLAQEIASLTSKLNELREITESNLSDIRFLDERDKAYNFSVNLRIDREADVITIADTIAKLTKGGDII
ncbi:hypothetical protein AB1282_00370 [Gottfriedia sp. S16(2024)]|uniref:hypothetical protein n=1 Tax=Gottfriedia sp. S16(2024) TaxID=3162883 RepID=UPI003D1E38DC